jgi:hypothetical protein
MAVLQEDSASSTVSSQSYTFLQVAKLRGFNIPVVEHLLEATNIDALDSVEQFVRLNQFEEATNVLTNINPINAEEQYQMDVLTILISGELNKTSSYTASRPRVISYLDAEQVSELEYIAQLDATGHRVPVLMANAILGRNDWSVEGFEERVSFVNPIRKTLLHLYPNPTMGHFYLEVAEPIESLQVYDAFGQLRLHQISPAAATFVVIDLNGAEAGVYMVKARLATSQEVLSTVFVKVAN